MKETMVAFVAMTMTGCAGLVPGLFTNIEELRTECHELVVRLEQNGLSKDKGDEYRMQCNDFADDAKQRVQKVVDDLREQLKNAGVVQ